MFSSFHNTRISIAVPMKTRNATQVISIAVRFYNCYAKHQNPSFHNLAERMAQCFDRAHCTNVTHVILVGCFTKSTCLFKMAHYSSWMTINNNGCPWRRCALAGIVAVHVQHTASHLLSPSFFLARSFEQKYLIAFCIFVAPFCFEFRCGSRNQ